MKKQLQKIIFLFMLIFFISPVFAVNAASIPKVSFYSIPNSSYLEGQTVSFKVYSRNYSGKVQYRVELYNVNTKKSQELWASGDKYNRTLKPVGKTPVSLNYKINQPGTYKLIVYTKRADIPAGKAYNKKGNYDSTVTSKVFTVTKRPSKITLGTSKSDVITLLGKPSNAWTTNDKIYVMQYAKGEIYLNIDKSGTYVVGWKNYGIPYLKIEDKNTKAPPIKLGSTMAEVAKANGTPQIIPPYYLNKDDDYWMYPDKSIVFFDKNQRVISYVNKGSLRVFQGTAIPGAPAINHKSKIKDVIASMGTPDVINLFYIDSRYYGRYQVSVTTYPNVYTGDTYFVSFNTPYIYYQYKDSFIAFDKNQKLIHFYNAGNLKIDFGNADASFPGLEVNSSEDDIVKSMGTPGKIIDSFNGERTWYYGKSYLLVDNSGNLQGWTDNGELKINKNNIKPDAPVISIGSSKQEVLDAMGTPDNFRGSNWNYKDSSIGFDYRGHVTLIYNFSDNIKLSDRHFDPDSKGFAFDSSKDVVFEAMGNPDVIKADGENVIWEYGHNPPNIGSAEVSITFNKYGKVVSWYSCYNKTVNIKIAVISQYDPLAAPVTIGSSKEDVLRTMGAPSSMDSYWYYGYSYFTFDKNDKVSGWSNFRGNLKVFLRDRVEGATFTFDSTFDEVLDAMGTPQYILTEGHTMCFQGGWVNFDYTTNRVNAWSYPDLLNLTKIQPDPNLSAFKLGSTYQELLAVMGNPDRMDVERMTPWSPEYSDYATWRYGNSRVVFNQLGKIIRWNNNDNNLKIE